MSGQGESSAQTQSTRRDFLKAVGLGAAIPVFDRVASAVTPAENKPNIILCMTDDQGWGDVHFHSNELIDTPVLDRLAKSGASFDRFYVSPVCAPTRASLLTGRYSMRSGVHGVTRGQETMRSEETTIAEVFKKAGYATGCFGKWHNGAHFPYHPNGQGFDEFLGFCAGHWNNYFDTTLDHNGKMNRVEGYITDVLTDAAMGFIEKNRERPFFCYLPYNAPHSPWQVPDRYFEKYKARGLDDVTACAYGMCENIDDNLGRLFRRIEKLGLEENTIVLFLTDNGPNSDRYNGGMKGRKGSAHEGGIRVPLFIRWPGQIEAGTKVEQIAAHIDLLPTLAALCGIPMPETKPLDGLNLAPLLQGETRGWPDRKIYTHWAGRGSVRTQRWRAVTNGKSWELYDMQTDPQQKEDVAEKYKDILEQLRSAYERWYKDVTKNGFDPIPVPIGYPQSPEVTLPGHEAYLYPEKGKGISYVGRSGWANDWVTNWTDADAYPYWEVDVVRSGEYDITLNYCCPKSDLGARVRVEIGDRFVEGTIEKAQDPEPIPSPDRVPRKEVYEKVWAPLKLGTVQLGKGRTRLSVKALSKPGEHVMELKAVEIRKVGG